MWQPCELLYTCYLLTYLQRNYCLTSVNLSWNGFDYEGSVAVCEMLRGNKYLRVLGRGYYRHAGLGMQQVTEGG